MATKAAEINHMGRQGKELSNSLERGLRSHTCGELASPITPPKFDPGHHTLHLKDYNMTPGITLTAPQAIWLLAQCQSEDQLHQRAPPLWLPQPISIWFTHSTLLHPWPPSLATCQSHWVSPMTPAPPQPINRCYVTLLSPIEEQGKGT